VRRESMPIQILLISIGGALGALLRAFLAFLTRTQSIEKGLPMGTLGANFLGCFLIGLILGYLESVSYKTETLRLILVTGFLGSLTTFSTFSYEAISLLRVGKSLTALLYVAGSITGCLLLCGLGVLVSRGLVE